MQLKEFQTNVQLAPYTTYKIGGPAKYFLVAKNDDEIVNAIKVATENELSYFILGGGSNILVSDKGFDGLVIKPENNELSINGLQVKIGAGALLKDAVIATAKHSLAGFEWAVGIPGTIGGALRGNAGAYRQSISNALISINYWDGREVKSIRAEQCKFDYRHSIFKENSNWVILEAELEFEQGDKNEIKEKMETNIKKRVDIHIEKNPCAGCMFKNGDYKDLTPKAKEMYLEVEEFKESGVVPAGWLIDQLDLKGKTIGGAQVYKEHANFIINSNQASASDVATLISLVKQKVRNNFGIQLVEEVQYVGF